MPTDFNGKPNSMQQRPWKAVCSSASKEIPCTSCIPKVHYYVHKSLLTVPILSSCIQGTPIHPISSKSVLILLSHLSLGLVCGLFPVCSYQEPVGISILPTHGTCLAHLMLFNLITWIIFGEEIPPKRLIALASMIYLLWMLQLSQYQNKLGVFNPSNKYYAHVSHSFFFPTNPLNTSYI